MKCLVLKNDEFKRTKIYEAIKNYPSYTEYMGKNGLPIPSTTKGKDIVKNLDEIAIDIKNFTNEDLSKIEVITRLKDLIEKSYSLINDQ